MNKILPLLFLASSLLSCVDKTPELDEELFRTEQKEYESKKLKNTASKEEFIIANASSMQERLQLIFKVQSADYDFAGISTDSLYRLEGKPIGISSNQDFPDSSSDPDKYGGSRMLILIKEHNTFADKRFEDPYYSLYNCMDNFDVFCGEVDLAIMQELMSTHYIAVIEEQIRVNPSIENDKNFNSGFFIGQINVYDVIEDRPLIQMVIAAENSDQLSIREGGYFSQKPSEVILNDFNSNINVSIRQALRRHFDIPDKSRF